MSICIKIISYKDKKMQKNVVYNKGVIEIVSKPKAGESLKVYTRPEDKVYYKFDISGTKYRVFGNSIELMFNDGAKFVFVSIMDMLEESNPPAIVLNNGKEVSFETVVLKIADDEVYTKLIETQISFENKLKAMQLELANEFKRVEEMKSELEKEKKELFEFKSDKTLTKPQELKKVINKTQTVNKEAKKEFAEAVLVKDEPKEKEVESKKVIEKTIITPKPKDLEPKKSNLDDILSKDDSSKIDEIDSIIRELDIR